MQLPDFEELSHLLEMSCFRSLGCSGVYLLERWTPLYFLLENMGASLGAIKFLCTLRPEAVLEGEYGALGVLCTMIGWPGDLLGIIFDAANKVIQINEASGAETLVRPNFQFFHDVDAEEISYTEPLS